MKPENIFVFKTKPHIAISAWAVMACLGSGSLLFAANTAAAGEAQIVDAKARQSGDNFSFDVTIRHAETGWDHYANKWDVLAPSGDVLGERVLVHPHVNEQPFTRSLSGVSIPADIDHVMIRAYDNVDGFGKQRFRVDLPGR